MKTEVEKIITELAKAGIVVNDIYDLVNSDKSYPEAIPILIRFIKEGINDQVIKEGVIRALAVKEAKGKVSSVLLDEYERLSKDKINLRWVIGNTIYATITKDDIERILPIIEDKANGISRQMFVMALTKVQLKQAEDVLIRLLDDDEVALHAIKAIGKIKLKNAKEKILILTSHPNTTIRKEAQKVLKKL